MLAWGIIGAVAAGIAGILVGAWAVAGAGGCAIAAGCLLLGGVGLFTAVAR